MPCSEIDWNRRCVFLVTSQDGGILFDLDNDEFLKLNAVGSEMWALICSGRTEADVATSIAARSGVEKQLVTADLRSLLDSAAERGITPACIQHKNTVRPPLLAVAGPTFAWYGREAAASRPTPRSTMVIQALVILAFFDLILSIVSLKSLCRLVTKWPSRELKQNDPELIGRICTAVDRACVWYFRKAVCLQRSAVTTCMLRSAGIPAEMVVAARVMPMLPHAWVRVKGRVVNDHPKVESVYQPLVCF